MRFVTATQFRTKTRQLLKEVSCGDSVIVTFRRKPVVVLARFEPLGITSPVVRPFEQAWPEIEAALARSTPAYSSPEAALRVSRRRK